ncbi:Coiled-coil domain-containing protein 47 [Trichinella spiralis]|uniref:PAT complex subunit CCDC47 n=1 Tax=Trichinella spiralis TaxID=6334 RepID=A0A0V1BYH8_TRISP|nr:Coiled-coil domain-containing protein 47 [Trichinella spiralis]
MMESRDVLYATPYRPKSSAAHVFESIKPTPLLNITPECSEDDDCNSGTSEKSSDKTLKHEIADSSLNSCYHGKQLNRPFLNTCEAIIEKIKRVKKIDPSTLAKEQIRRNEHYYQKIAMKKAGKKCLNVKDPIYNDLPHFFRRMQEVDKNFINSVGGIVQNIKSIQSSISEVLAKLQMVDQPSLLNSFRVISSQFNSMLQLLRSDRASHFKNYVFLPIRLSVEVDADLEAATENRLHAWTHAVVPDYLRTKPDPQVEQKDQQISNQVQQRICNPESLQKQITAFNRCLNCILDSLNASIRDSEMDGSKTSKTSDGEDTALLVAAILKGQNVKPAYSATPASSRGSSGDSGHSKASKAQQVQCCFILKKQCMAKNGEKHAYGCSFLAACSNLSNYPLSRCHRLMTMNLLNLKNLMLNWMLRWMQILRQIMETPPVDTASIGAKRSPANAEQKRNDAPNNNFNDDDYGIVEDESVDDFSHLLDENEFENFPDERRPGKQNAGPSKTVTQLKITDVPGHLRNNWNNFVVELFLIFGLIVYTKNHSLAVAWFDSNRPFLEENFSIVGDDGISPEVTKNVLIKESDNHYIVWCSGRQGCIGMEIHLKLIKRQDLLSLIFYIIRPKFDVIEIKIILNPEEMDPFVFALGTKRSAIKNSKEIMDLNLYCSEKKNVEKLGLPSSYILHSEIGEVTTGLIDSKIVSALCKYKDVVDYIHISDQFVGIKPIEMENMTKPPETAKVVMICLNIPGQLRATEEDVSSLQPLMIFIFHVLEKVRRFRLTREGKQKADKNRQYVEESFLKTTHAQRQEAAQQRREERARERKERLMAEEDPERQRKLEKQELKRELKKKQPRVKQIKIKAMLRFLIKAKQIYC